MSLLANIAQQSGLPTRSVIPANSVSATVIWVKKIVYKVNGVPVGPKPGAKCPPPAHMSLIFTSDVRVPYNFQKGTKDNMYTEAQVGVEPKFIPAGTETVIVSMFNPPSDLISGGIYRLKGLFFTTFHLPGKEPGFSYSCVGIETATDLSVAQVMDAIPFPNRSVDVLRDVPQVDCDYDVKGAWRFVHVKVSDCQGLEDYPGEVHGKLMQPDKYDKTTYYFTPQTGPSVPAFTGGMKDNKFDDLQFYLQQNGLDNEKIVILGRCKLFGESLRRLQVKWESFGAVFGQHFFGDVLATIDRGKSLAEPFDRTSGVAGALNLATNFHPDMARMAMACGVKMSWRNCVKFAPQLANPSSVNHADFCKDDILWANAVNLLQFTGDVSEMEAAEARGEVEFYVVTNADYAPTDLPEDEEERVTFLMNPKGYYYRAVGTRETAVFALTTESYDGTIRDFLSTTPGKPPLISSKRIKLE